MNRFGENQNALRIMFFRSAILNFLYEIHVISLWQKTKKTEVNENQPIRTAWKEAEEKWYYFRHGRRLRSAGQSGFTF